MRPPCNTVIITINHIGKEVQIWPSFIQRQSTSNNMTNWTKAKYNPVMDPVQMRRGWDHCVWKEDDKYMMATGGREGIQLFTSRDLRKWDYLHPLFDDDPKRGLSKWDCPHLFKLGDKHVVIVYAHPMRQNIYFVGRYADRRLHVEEQGNLDLGVNAGGTFCAAHPSSVDAKGRQIVVGFMQERIHERLPLEIRTRRTWSNALSLPRVMTLGEDNRLRFAPVEEVKSLRGTHQHFADIELTMAKPSFQTAVKDNCLEIKAVLDPGQSSECGLKLLCGSDGKEKLRLQYDSKRQHIALNGLGESLKLAKGESLRLHVFIDQSLVEVFVNERSV